MCECTRMWRLCCDVTVINLQSAHSSHMHYPGQNTHKHTHTNKITAHQQLNSWRHKCIDFISSHFRLRWFPFCIIYAVLAPFLASGKFRCLISQYRHYYYRSVIIFSWGKQIFILNRKSFRSLSYARLRYNMTDSFICFSVSVFHWLIEQCYYSEGLFI